MNDKIMIFIPTYNCENQITRVFENFNDEILNCIDSICVFDNGSVDSTVVNSLKYTTNLSKKVGASVFVNTYNYGLGGSHKAAFAYAIKNGFDYIIVLHGDDQANILDIADILKSKLYKNYDAMLGARFMNGSRLVGYSKIRTIGNIIYNAIFSICSNKKIYDLGSGLNIYKLSSFSDNFYLKFPDDLTFNYALLLGSIHKSHKVKFFPITWRESDQVSNVKLIRQSFRVLSILARYAISENNFMLHEMRKVPYENYTSNEK